MALQPPTPTPSNASNTPVPNDHTNLAMGTDRPFSSASSDTGIPSSRPSSAQSIVDCWKCGCSHAASTCPRADRTVNNTPNLPTDNQLNNAFEDLGRANGLSAISGGFIPTFGLPISQSLPRFEDNRPPRSNNAFNGGMSRGGAAGDSLGCRRCGQIGHYARECTVPRLCYNCNQGGHDASACNNQRSSNAEGQRSGPGPSRHEPKFMQPEQLFDIERIHTGENFENSLHEQVKVLGKIPAQPKNSFNDMNLLVKVVENIKKCGYTKPTPVQANCIPLALKMADIAACAKTGSGKTAAFLVPIIHHLLSEEVTPRQMNATQAEPRALILSPIRELAIQIYNEARKFAAGTTLVEQINIVYGGTGVEWNRSVMLKDTKILVATPGRLFHFIETGYFIVLDEADRLLSFGFEHGIRMLFNNENLPLLSNRMTLMFSATFPEEIQTLAKDFFNPGYSFVTVGKIGAANHDVLQMIYEVSRAQKTDQLVEECRKLVFDSKMSREGEADRWTRKVLIFAERKRTTDTLASYLCRSDLPATSINGDREQNQREQALQDLKDGRVPILVATEVAARGLDIPLVDCVINYDMPNEIESYVHRIGRTGRVGNKGKSISFFDPQSDKDLGQKLVANLMEAQQEVPEFLMYYARGTGTSANKPDNGFGEFAGSSKGFD